MNPTHCRYPNPSDLTATPPRPSTSMPKVLTSPNRRLNQWTTRLSGRASRFRGRTAATRSTSPPPARAPSRHALFLSPFPLSFPFTPPLLILPLCTRARQRRRPRARTDTPITNPCGRARGALLALISGRCTPSFLAPPPWAPAVLSQQPRHSRASPAPGPCGLVVQNCAKRH